MYPPVFSPDECNVEELSGVLASTRLSQWMQVFPLTEDIELCQLPPLSQVHINLDFTTAHRAQLSQTQEVRSGVKRWGEIWAGLGVEVILLCFRVRFVSG